MEQARAGSRTREFPSLDWRPPPPAPRPGAAADEGRRFWLLAGTAGALALLLLTRSAGSLLFGTAGLHLPVLEIDVPLAVLLWGAPPLLLWLWDRFLRAPVAHGRWRTLTAVGLGLLALLGCLRAHGVRHDLAGQTFVAVVATAGAVDYLWRLRRRQRTLGGLGGLLGWLRAHWRQGAAVLAVPVVFGLSVWAYRAFVREPIAFAHGRIAELPRGMPRLDRANLLGSNLRGIAMTGVEVSNSDLRFADLQGAALRASSFRQSRLQGARLGHATLTNVAFRGGDLRGAELTGLTGKDVVFEETDLRGARLADLAVEGLRFKGANLRDVDLRGQSLKGIDFSASALEGARLGGARAEGTKFNDADLERSVLDAANLSGAEFLRARLIGASALRTNLQLAKLRDAHLEGADLSQADLRGADLTCADLRRAKLPARELFVAAVLDRALMSPTEARRFAGDARAKKICFGIGAGRCAPAVLRKACPHLIR
jgi:uncharacterized protein YjbI with pentapeptide repeats